MKICSVSNFNNYYRAPVYEALGARPGYDVDFVFYSGGTERYWVKDHGITTGAGQIDLSGVTIGSTRITPGLIACLLGKPYDVYFKCINGKFALIATWLVAKARRRPFVLWTEVWMRFRTREHRIGYPLLRRIYADADAIAACGVHVRDHLIAEGVEADKIVVARHAVQNTYYAREVGAPERAERREALKIAEDQPVVLYVGRFTPVKGLDTLLKGFAELIAAGRDAGAVLVMAGTGELEGELRAMANSLGITERLRWPGYVARRDIVSYYSVADLLALTSVELDHMKETWGLVVNEAFCQGVPVVASDAVGAAAGGLVQDGRTGRIVPERDPAALAAAMGDLLTDNEERGRMAIACRAEIARWTSEGMAAGFAEAIDLGVARFSQRTRARQAVS